MQFIPLPNDRELLKPATNLLETDIVSIIDFKNQAPNYFLFDQYSAFNTRVVSFINGTIYAIHNSSLSHAVKKEKIAALHQLASRKKRELNVFKSRTQNSSVVFDAELYHFYNKELPQISGLKSKEIALAEAFYVWQHVKRPARVTRFKQGDLTIEQKDTPRHSPLTLDQKSELIKIHQLNKPHWFRKLPTFAQAMLQNIVPKEVHHNWENYEKCRPAILRHIPGEANATAHELYIYDQNEKLISHSLSVRQGTPTSFNMSNSAERKESAAHNLAQMLDEQLETAKREFKNKWGVACPLDFPVLLGGLVTPAEQAGWLGNFLDRLRLSGGENNTKLAREKELALDSYLREPPSKTVFFNLNVAVNDQRKGFVKPDPAFMGYLEKFITAMEAATGKQKLKRLEILKKLLTTLKNHPPAFIPKGRNPNLYLAAYYEVAMRVMKGLATGNCKSSKDRKGVELMMADAMLAYYFQHKTFPEVVNAIGKKRQDFVDIFCKFYASGHQLLIAHDNSPGSAGIKDEGILDKDIKQKLQTLRQHPKEEGIYSQSKTLANFNKPGTFWKKYGNKIKRIAIIGSALILGGISIALTATGVLSPLGVIGATAALKLGAAATFIGGAVNGGIAVASGAIIAGVVVKYKDKYVKNHDQQTMFSAQMPTLTRSTTSRMPFPIAQTTTLPASKSFTVIQPAIKTQRVPESVVDKKSTKSFKM